jgi:hypothetical protein
MTASRHEVRAVSVRAAIPSDAQAVAEIGASVDVRTMASLGKGYLLFPWPAEKIRRHLLDGGLISVFSVPPATDVVGFISGFFPDHVERILRCGRDDAESTLLRAIRDAASAHGDLYYAVVYQMAISPSLHSRGLGSAFFGCFADQTRCPHYGVVVERPLRSVRRAFWWGLGFRPVGEIAAPMPHDLHAVLDPSYAALTMSWAVMRRRQPEERREGT